MNETLTPKEASQYLKLHVRTIYHLAKRRCTMLTGIELMQWIEHFGRWNVQEFVAKSQDMRDVLTYLKAERSLELAEIMPFATSDSVRFEKRTSFTPVSEESWNMCRRWINSELWKSGFDYTDIVGCDGEFFL